jgi:hypothetical protein
MRYKILKWFMPVISYFAFVGLFYFWGEIDIWIFGNGELRKGGTPLILPDNFMFFVALPLIPWGYILLATAQYLHKKRRKWFKRFAWGVTSISIILFLILEYIYNTAFSLLYFLWIMFPIIMFYYVPFFLSLSYILKKKLVRQRE